RDAATIVYNSGHHGGPELLVEGQRGRFVTAETGEGEVQAGAVDVAVAEVAEHHHPLAQPLLHRVVDRLDVRPGSGDLDGVEHRPGDRQVPGLLEADVVAARIPGRHHPRVDLARAVSGADPQRLGGLRSGDRGPPFASAEE